MISSQVACLRCGLSDQERKSKRNLYILPVNLILWPTFIFFKNKLLICVIFNITTLFTMIFLKKKKVWFVRYFFDMCYFLNKKLCRLQQVCCEKTVNHWLHRQSLIGRLYALGSLNLNFYALCWSWRGCWYSTMQYILVSRLRLFIKKITKMLYKL